MLLFAQRPDEIIQDIVREALTWMEQDLKECETDPRAIEGVAPRAAPYLTTGVALETIMELLTALDRPQIYALEPVQRLLVADALTRYCESYNAHPQDTDVHERYAIQKLDCTRLLTVFLGALPMPSVATTEQATQQAVQLYIIADPPWQDVMPKDQSPWCGSGPYPSQTNDHHV